MFNRRRHHASPLGNPNPDPSAATAALQAFLASRASNASLSSSAAAAALRAHTTSPTQVSEVQTKRTLRRAASTSSNGSSNASGSIRGPGGRRLQRKGSSGSMTERTFRDPSPNRTATRPHTGGAPPVPAIPDKIPELAAARRASSLEPQMRINSPPPKRTGGRGVSLDRYDGQAPRSAGIPSLTAVTEKDIERPGSRGSVNFSYPLNGPNSPKLGALGDKRLTPASSGEPRVGSPALDHAKIRRGLDTKEVADVQLALRETADRPVKKKKKAVARETVEGRHLEDGSAGGRPHGTAVDNNRSPSSSKDGQFAAPNVDSPDTVLAAAPRKGKKKKIARPVPQYRDSGTSTADYPSSIASVTSDHESMSETPDSTPPQQRSQKARGAGLLVKQPSIVREDREREEREEQIEKEDMSGGPQDALRKLEAKDDSPAAESKGDQQRASQLAPSVTTTVPTPTTATFPSVTVQSSPVLESSGSLRANRPQSLSPSRNARFSATPLVTSDTGLVKHQPPLRSVSPAKSALKHSPSSRNASPMGGIIIGKVQPQSPSVASDDVSVRSEDSTSGIGRGSSKKKKNVRVSFEDGPTKADRTEPTSDIPDPPDTKTRWFPLGKGKDKDETSPTFEDEEAIKPVPVLPTFGSIRAKRDRNEGGDRIEKVTESVTATSTSGSGGVTAGHIEASSDIALGAIIAKDFASRSKPVSQKAETSTQPTQRSFSPNDPLPPEVTSVEGTGWNSDTDGSLFDDDKSDVSTRLESESRNSSDAVNVETRANDKMEPQVNPKKANGDVPSVVLVKPTPTVEKTEDRQEWLSIPGGFPSTPEPGFHNDSDLEERIAERHVTDLTPASTGIAEPEPQEAAGGRRPGSPVLGESAAGVNSQMNERPEDESDSSGDSIYSDAAEDLSDLEGDGFLSIDAVVESPMIESVVDIAVISPTHSPAVVSSKDIKSPGDQTGNIKNEEDTEPKAEEGWEEAQAYWQGLSAQKKRQMERAAVPIKSSEPATPVTPEPVKRKPGTKQVATAAQVSRESESGYSPDSPTPKRKERRQTQPSANTASTGMKKSMREQPANTASETHMRSSMRSTSMRGSMREEPSGTQLGTASQYPETSQQKGLLQKRNIRSAAPISAVYSTSPVLNGNHRRNMSGSTTASSVAPPAQQFSPKKTGKMSTLRRTLSNESDSDSASSFKRAPRSTSSSGFAMRRTMRGPPPAAESSPKAELNARQLSPAGSATRRPFSPGASSGSRLGQGTMRTSMRDSSNLSLRSNSTERTKSPTRSSLFGKSSKPSKPVLKPIRSGFSSRFADSSDEEESKPTFRSRFVDSDSDDGAPAPIAFTPVRGIPRRPGQDDEDSTELSDSSDDNAGTTRNRKRSSTNTSKTKRKEGSALQSGSLRRSGSGRDLSTTVGSTSALTSPTSVDKEKKRSFFGLGRKRKDNKVRKLEIESAARRGTPLERSKLELAAVNDRPGTGSSAGRKRVSKLIGEEWPLPVSAATNGNGASSFAKRPRTADGDYAAAADGKETSGEGSVPAVEKALTDADGEKGVSWDNSVEEPGQSGTGTETGKGGKRKKRFTFLRKVFKLDT